MNTVKEVINNNADTIRTNMLEHYKEELNKHWNKLNDLNYSFPVDVEQHVKEVEERTIKLLQQTNFIYLKDNKKYSIKEFGKYGEVTVQALIKVFSFNIEDNSTEVLTETRHFDYILDLLNEINNVEWKQFTELVQDKTMLAKADTKAVIELMLV